MVSEVTPGLIQEYRVHRTTSRKNPKTGVAMRPCRSIIHQEIITIRHVLKNSAAPRMASIRSRPLSTLSNVPEKISHRAWFSPEEYEQLYEATRRRAQNPPKKRWKWACEQLHDFELFMVNTGLRPDEATRSESRDVEFVEDQNSGEAILEISVRGKRGVGYCKSMPGAIVPFERLKRRNNPQPTDRLFPKIQRGLFNTILDEEGLKKDR